MKPLPDAGALLAAGAVVAGALVGERLGPGDGIAVAAAALAVGLLGVGAGVASACNGAGRAGGKVARAGAAGGDVAAGGARGAEAAVGGLVLAALGLIAAASMQRALDGLAGPAAVLAAEGAEAVVTADLTEDPRRRPGAVRVTARLRTVDPGRGTGQSLVLLSARGSVGGRVGLLSAGDAVIVSGWFRPLEAWEHHLRWRHVIAAVDVTDLHAAGPPRSPVLRLANAVRAAVLRGTDPLGNRERALTAGFLVGDDRGLPPEVAADFRAAGLSHLLVVSGANVALALALAGPLLSRLAWRGRLGGGLAVIGLFAAMTRFEPSVLRASAMAALALLARYLGRPASGARYLALAVAGLVLVDPFLVRSLAFQLSCGASAGIILLARPLGSRLPGPAWARDPLAVTAAAQVGVAPVALPVFGGLPLAALPANLAAAPAAAALTVWGLGAGLLGGVLAPWAPGAPFVVSAPTGALAAYVAVVARLSARLPGTLGPAQAAMIAGMIGLVAGFPPLARRLLRRRRRPAAARGAAADRRTTTRAP